MGWLPRLALKHGNSVRLLSRKGKNLTPDYPDVVEAVQGIKAKSALLDGEIVALDDQGKPSFQITRSICSI
jgi:bifunctional non-homologous end joining protein LigD